MIKENVTITIASFVCYDKLCNVQGQNSCTAIGSECMGNCGTGNVFTDLVISQLKFWIWIYSSLFSRFSILSKDINSLWKIKCFNELVSWIPNLLYLFKCSTLIFKINLSNLPSQNSVQTLSPTIPRNQILTKHFSSFGKMSFYSLVRFSCLFKNALFKLGKFSFILFWNKYIYILF